MNEYKAMWIRWSDFGGKSSLREFWMAFLIHFIIAVILGILVSINANLGFLSGIYGLLAFIPFLALSVRRMHDVGKSGLYLLWLLLPIIGLIMVIIALASQSK